MAPGHKLWPPDAASLVTTLTPSEGVVARPHLELGTHGRVRVYPDPAGYRAVCLYRDWDGVTRQVQRQARTKGSAERALAVALRDRGRPGTDHEITPDTKIAVLAEKWYSELEGKSPSTMQAYRDRLDRQVSRRWAACGCVKSASGCSIVTWRPCEQRTDRRWRR